MSMLASLHASGVSCGHLQARAPSRPATCSLNSAFSGCSLRQPSAARQPQRQQRLQTCARQAGAEEDDNSEGAGRRGRRGAPGGGGGRSGDDRKNGDRRSAQAEPCSAALCKQIAIQSVRQPIWLVRRGIAPYASLLWCHLVARLARGEDGKRPHTRR